MKKYILLISLSVVSVMICAQGQSDLLNFSLTDINGSARYMSMSGAFGALGGDVSVLGRNPAGIAVFRTSEFSMTSSFTSTSANSNFNKKISENNRSNAAISNFGYIGSFRTLDESAITNFNFGISYNKTRDFNRSVSISGIGRTSSLLDKICENQEVTSTPNKDLTDLGYMAYNTGLIFPTNDINGDYYKSILREGELVDSKMKFRETGAASEWNFSLGANYSHNLYVGMSVGVQSINYELLSEYSELSNLAGWSPVGFELDNVLSTQGTGVNVKLGAIFRPLPELRLGLAYHSPTYYYMTDVYSSTMTSDLVTVEAGSVKINASIKESSADYQIHTPSRLIYSMAYQLGEKGFLSLDWDVIDYGEIKLKDAEGFAYDDANLQMRGYLKAVSNLRVGAEFRLTETISLRGGAAWHQSPYKSTVVADNEDVFTNGTNLTEVAMKPQYEIEKDTYFVSGGIGYRTGGFFLDAAIQYQLRKENFYNFHDNTDNSAPKYADLNTNKTNVVVTCGFKF